MAVSASLWGALFLCFLVSLTAPVSATNGLRVGFYRRSCPNVEKIIFRSLYQSYKADQRIAPGVLRIAFHDCFVRGCDASILLDGPDAEKQAIPNSFNNQTYAALECAKRAVEKACPGVVSCADVLQYAARDAVIISGGFGWAVPAGRRDGCISKMEDATTMNLPSPHSNASVLIELFQSKGLTPEQMVALSGAHTIGSASCFTFDNRIQVPKADPTLNPGLARSLKRQCPTPGLKTKVFMDSTPHKFDSHYFLGLVQGKGVMSSDQALMENPRTRRSVYAYRNPSTFSRDFASAMVAMSQIQVLTGHQGEIRRHMSVVNHH